jgi:hypothetical protein
MTKVLVIHETDLKDREQTVIGVADSLENAELVIDEYYGEFEEILDSSNEVSNIAYSKILEVDGAWDTPRRVAVWTQWFKLNHL